MQLDGVKLGCDYFSSAKSAQRFQTVLQTVEGMYQHVKIYARIEQAPVT